MHRPTDRFAAGGVGAVLLVDDDGVVDLPHDDVLEDEAGDGGGPGAAAPRLDAHAVGGAGEGAVGHAQPADVLLAGVPAEAADADAVPGAARHPGHHHVGGARADGDAVVAGGHGRVRDAHVGGALDVHAVRVGAAPRRPDAHAVDRHVVAAHHRDVEELAVQRRHPRDRRVPHQPQLDGLMTTTTMNQGKQIIRTQDRWIFDRTANRRQTCRMLCLL